MAQNIEDEWNYNKEGKGKHRHMERNEDKMPPKADEENVPDSSETTPDLGRERMLKGRTLPVTLKAAHRIQSEADKHPNHPVAQVVKREAMSTAEHSTHAHV